MTNTLELAVYGTRGSCATGSREYTEFGGDTSSYALRYGNVVRFLDGGSGIRRAMAEHLTRDVEKAYLDITHGHLDHTDMGCAGGIYFNHLRDGIQVAGYRDVEKALRELFDNDTRWPVPFAGLNGVNKKVMALEGGERLDYEDCTVRTLRNYHPNRQGESYGGSIGFRYDLHTLAGVTVSVAYVTDMEFDFKENAQPQPLAERLKRDFVDFVTGVDILIADTHFTRDEYTRVMPFVRGWGHSPLETVIELAKEAGVKKLYGTHHAPQHNDGVLRQLEFHAIQYGASIGFEGQFRFARDGDRINLGPAPDQMRTAA